MSPRWLVFAPVIFLLLWSGGYTVAKIALESAEPMTLLALRYGCVLAIMIPLFFIIRPPLPERRADWMHLAIVGFLIQTVYFGFCWLAFRVGVAAGTVALVMSFQPVLVALIAPRWTGEPVGMRRWIGLIIGLVGTAIVINSRTEVAGAGLIGYFFMIMGLLGMTIASLWEKRFGRSHHPITQNMIGYGAGFIGVLPFMLTLDTMHIDWNWEFGIAVAYLVLCNSILAIGLLLAMIRAGDVSAVSSLMFLVPPIAALMAWIGLGEILPPIGWLGMVIAAVGVYLATRKNAVG
ncbi:multidrug DMT transporter permease [Amylibacter kogurei]|uniref:Multidrug DMT transporter permease n=1 Tax=Paramylibacter kogurei TaxID=1889778 RepID=A0A2G5K302_9RHOB|nr:DMT family transporter [Amylibacter kogurei]PIB23906.1 multidrug DMT transporter permease [Amylibacter kogurei]